VTKKLPTDEFNKRFQVRPQWHFNGLMRGCVAILGILLCGGICTAV